MDVGAGAVAAVNMRVMGRGGDLHTGGECVRGRLGERV